jgi:hypothetical protein
VAYSTGRHVLGKGEGVIDMRKELTISELDDQQVELLPARETLYVKKSYVNIWAFSAAAAFNVQSDYSLAAASSQQYINVG